MKHWFKDQQLRSLLKNTSYLGLSRIVAAVCGIATVAVAGRGLGLLLFGTLILITSYTKAISGLAKFQSWQVIVRYGGHGMARGDPEHFKIATGFAFSLDLLSGIAGMLVGVAILPFIAQWVGIEPQFLWLAVLYCTLLPTMGAATPSGVLRVLDRFDLIGWAGTLTPIARALLAATAYFVGAPFAAYVLIWYATDLAGDLFTWFLAWRELRRTGHLEGIQVGIQLGRGQLRQSGRQRAGSVGTKRAARCRRAPRSCRRGAIPRGLDPRRCCAKARGSAR